MGKQGSFNILHDISENVTLVHLMETFVNVNHGVSIVGYWIFDSNYKFSLPLTIDPFNRICSPFLGEGLVAWFKTVFYAFRYIQNTGKLKISG